jgi:hypothetical protein
LERVLLMASRMTKTACLLLSSTLLAACAVDLESESSAESEVRCDTCTEPPRPPTSSEISNGDE